MSEDLYPLQKRVVTDEIQQNAAFFIRVFSVFKSTLLWGLPEYNWLKCYIPPELYFRHLLQIIEQLYLSQDIKCSIKHTGNLVLILYKSIMDMSFDVVYLVVFIFFIHI